MRVTAFAVIVTLITVAGCHRVKLAPETQILKIPAAVPDDAILCVQVTPIMHFAHPSLAAGTLCGPTVGAFRESLVHVLRAN